MSKDSRLIIRIDTEVLNRLRELADDERRPLTQLVRNVIDDYLELNKKTFLER